MTQDEIIEMARQAGLFIAHDSEGQFSAVHDGEIFDIYPDRDKERDRLYREQRFVEILGPFAKLVAAKEREHLLKVWDNAVKAEREACAVIAEEWFCGCGRGRCPEGDLRAQDIANSIRARGEA